MRHTTTATTRSVTGLATAIFLATASPTLAAPPTLRLPLDCDLGETCFLQQYVDADPGPGAADYTGGPLAYDGHRGTDLRVADQEAMAAGVPVLAPAAGIVRGVRDGMQDRIMTDRAEVAGRECGNGVAIDHGDGWETQLCHLARGSVSVAAGDRVAAGDPVGLVGLSGATQFPHVHLSVRHRGQVIDPFIDDLWQVTPPYEPGGFLSVGLSSAVPPFADIKAGTADADSLPPDAPALVVWAAMFGGQAGDRIALRILGPNGAEVFAHDATLERTQAELFRAAGRRLNATRWRGGTYTGTATLMRDGEILDRIETAIPIR
ncbi:M23 family metallopeptidase [Jannaschia sp. 2305UL9-9]|uniref:M23 family metallopeptidase n=1 Tax=Jannaschia sp. 2305UL9-9 TaxID=3121638 RepID=UPI003527BC54